MERISLKATLTEGLGKIMDKHKNAVLCSADYLETLGVEELVTQFQDRHMSFGAGINTAVGAASGLTVRGKIPLLVGLASNLHEASKAIKDLICVPNLNVKIIGGMAGDSLAEDGEGMISNDDLAFFSSFPNMKVVCPADYYEVLSALEVMFLDYGPVYMRLPGPEIPVLFDESYEFDFAEGCILSEGKKATIFAMGEAVEKIMAQDLDVELINMSSLKPLDQDLILDCARKAERVLVMEDHDYIGGLACGLSELFMKERNLHWRRIEMKEIERLPEILEEEI